MTLSNKGSAGAVFLSAIGILAVGALIWWAIANLEVSRRGEVENDDIVIDGEPLNVPNDWRTFSSEIHGFSITHPVQVNVAETPQEVTFRFEGANNEAGDVVTDGFELSISKEDYSGHTSLQAYAAAQYQNELFSHQAVLSPEPTTFNDRQAYAAVVRTPQGTSVEHIFVEHGVPFALHLSWYVVDDNEQGYAALLDLMLKTLDFETESAGAPLFTKVKIALLDTSPEGEADRGCDDVVLVERNTISPTTQPLNAALALLFMEDEEQVEGNFNFIARTNESLTFVRATLDQGTANVYLEGSLSGLSGVCDDPRAKIQIEETALQFPTVDAVRIFLNGEETDLQPSQQ